MIRLAQMVSKHQKKYKVVQESYGYTKETVQKAHNLLKSYAKHVCVCVYIPDRPESIDIKIFNEPPQTEISALHASSN